MAGGAQRTWSAQQERNAKLIQKSRYLRDQVVSRVLPIQIDIARCESLSSEQATTLRALEIEAARIAIKSLSSLSKLNEVDHLGGGLDLLPALLLTLSITDYEKREFSIEHAHTSIGYYSALAACGYLDQTVVIDEFRRGLNIPGHVSWVPGGTESNGGRLGVMVPVAVGQALGKKAVHGEGAWMVTHLGDAGWISGQALNGFNAADLHQAPITFVMHRNGIQLSGSNKQIMDKDPRPIIESLGIEILEVPSLLETGALYSAYREAYQRAQQGRPSLIYPVGFGGFGADFDLHAFGRKFGISEPLKAFAAKHGVPLETKVWVPGSLMSYRDLQSMLECVFLVNDLKGGHGHHDGHMKGRDLEAVLANPMLQFSAEESAALKRIQGQPKHEVITKARPAPGTPNLVLSAQVLQGIKLPAPGESVSARVGVEAAYAAVAKAFPENVFIVSADLDPSTKLGKARTLLKADHQFELSIEEQAATLVAAGLAMSNRRPQLNVFSTFGAFYEGIAREGMELWRYTRNLNGVNEGLNVTLHLSHVGACTGRDHFSGWSLDWITLGLGYLPYLHRFYTPADARSAFVAIRDLAAHYGGHLIGIPRDNLPVLARQDGSGPLWEANSPWEALTALHSIPGAKRAILGVGATAFVAREAAQTLQAKGTPTDAYVVNGFPLPEESLSGILRRYPQGIVTIEDGIIATPAQGLRGFAGLLSGLAYGSGIPLDHLGIVDPRIAPADGHLELWEHFGITAAATVEAIQRL